MTWKIGFTTYHNIVLMHIIEAGYPEPNKGKENGVYLMSLGGYEQLLDPSEVAQEYINEYNKHLNQSTPQ